MLSHEYDDLNKVYASIYTTNEIPFYICAFKFCTFKSFEGAFAIPFVHIAIAGIK